MVSGARGEDCGCQQDVDDDLHVVDRADSQVGAGASRYSCDGLHTGDCGLTVIGRLHRPSFTSQINFQIFTRFKKSSLPDDITGASVKANN